MGTIDAKIDSRSKQEKHNADFDSGREEDVRGKSKSDRSEYVRTRGTDSSERNFSKDRESASGKIVHQLIDEYNHQIARKHEQKRQIEAEIVELSSRVEEFHTLLEELESDEKS